ncbi:MAG: hypothetical protein LBS07_05825 [Prevotellaceae bacterium]|jgi:hypothetical protein|nr:hypothetical protein [Prevotellaceae bacterium]
MKSIEKIKSELTEDKLSLVEKHILIVKERRDWRCVYSGTEEACEDYMKEYFGEYDENLDEYVLPDFGIAEDNVYKIKKNEIADQWENPVTGIGYLKMASGDIITYHADDDEAAL